MTTSTPAEAPQPVKIEPWSEFCIRAAGRVMVCTGLGMESVGIKPILDHAQNVRVEEGKDRLNESELGLVLEHAMNDIRREADGK